MATDLYQLALAEQCLAWDEKKCSSPIPHNGLANSREPQCKGPHCSWPLALFHSVQWFYPAGSHHSCRAPHCREMAGCVRRQGLQHCPTLMLEGEGRGIVLSLKFHGSLLTILRTWLSALPSLPLQFSTWYGGVITTSSMTTMFFSCHLQSLMLEEEERRSKLPLAGIPHHLLTPSSLLTIQPTTSCQQAIGKRSQETFPGHQW